MATERWNRGNRSWKLSTATRKRRRLAFKVKARVFFTSQPRVTHVVHIVLPGQARIARGIHGLPKVSPWPAMPDPSMPCGRAVSGVARSQGGRPAAVFYPLGYPTPCPAWFVPPRLSSVVLGSLPAAAPLLPRVHEHPEARPQRRLASHQDIRPHSLILCWAENRVFW
jgi:hypothetical protein